MLLGVFGIPKLVLKEFMSFELNPPILNADRGSSLARGDVVAIRFWIEPIFSNLMALDRW